MAFRVGGRSLAIKSHGMGPVVWSTLALGEVALLVLEVGEVANFG